MSILRRFSVTDFEDFTASNSDLQSVMHVIGNTFVVASPTVSSENNDTQLYQFLQT